MQVSINSRRPSERTEKFLQEYLSQQYLSAGDRLPSLRHIATEIDVSISTVRSVINKWLKEGRLSSRQGSGVFIGKTPPGSQPLRIGANVSNKQPSGRHWGDSIHLYALEAVIKLGPKGSFTSLYSATENVDDLTNEEVALRCRDLDGMILYQSDPHTTAIADYCRQNGKPIIYLSPPTDEAVANYVALENYASFFRITRALREAGRKRFVLLLNPALESSVSVRQLLSGTVNGIEERLGVSVDLRILICKGFYQKDGRDTVRKLLDEETFRPDAILCAGDGLALGALEALQESGLSVPSEVSVISGSGIDSKILGQKVTTLVHPLREIGRTLISMLLDMIEGETFDLPARILPVGIETGWTTTPEESEKLSAAFQG